MKTFLTRKKEKRMSCTMSTAHEESREHFACIHGCCSDAWFLVFHPQDIGLCFQILPSMAAYAAAATASAGKRRHRQVGQVFPFPFFSWH